jgi:hypothetical protein
MRVRCIIGLSLSVAMAVVACFWPTSARLTIDCEHGCWHVAFSRDGTTVAVLDREPGVNPRANILLWDTAAGTLLHRIDVDRCAYPHRLFFAPDGTLGLLDAGVVTKWDTATARRLATYDHAEWPHDPDHYPGSEILFAPEGRWLLHNVHVGRVYDIETGDVVHDYAERWPDRSLYAHGGCVVARTDGEVRTFDAVTGGAIASFPTASRRWPLARTSCAFSGDGTHGIYFTESGRWVVHDAQAGTECTWAEEGYGPSDLALSPDRRYLAVASAEGHGGVTSIIGAHFAGTRWHIAVIDTTTGRDVGRHIPAGFISCFAPDGKTLAVADRAKRITLWDWPPPSRWPLAVGLGVLGMTLPLGIAALLGRAWSRCRRQAQSIKPLYPPS